MRSLKELRWLFRSDGSIDETKLRRVPVERRGEYLSAAGYVIGFAPALGTDLPPGVKTIAREFLDAEPQEYRAELYAAAIAGQAWRQEDLGSEDSDTQGCLRCGKNASWRPVVVASSDLAPEVAWRLKRPENHIPFCKDCTRTAQLAKRRGLRIDLAWGLWAGRFEALWRWFRAAQDGSLPPDWDRLEYPLWPKEFGGATWETGSGHVSHCRARGPKGIVRLKIHGQAVERALDHRSRPQHPEEDTPLGFVIH